MGGVGKYAFVVVYFDFLFEYNLRPLSKVLAIYTCKIYKAALHLSEDREKFDTR